MTLVNDRTYTLEVPCKRGLLGMECTEADYKSWRKVATALRETVVKKILDGGFEGQNIRAITSWLLAWVDKDAEIGLVQKSLAFVRSATEGNPDLNFSRKLFGYLTPIDVYAGRFPPDPPFELAVAKSFGFPVSLGPTVLTMSLINYIREGYPFVEKGIDAGTLSQSDIAGELDLAQERPPGVINWIPLAIAGGSIIGGALIVAYFISIFVRARRGQVTLTGPITELGATYAKTRTGRR